MSLVEQTGKSNIYEAGCGEGNLSLMLKEKGYQVHGSDFSKSIINIARAEKEGYRKSMFEVKSIYNLNSNTDKRDLVCCCEVLEHIEHPRKGLESLLNIVGQYIIMSVPREPIWRAMNFVRGKYISEWGNTPGHINHWSRRQFVDLVSDYFEPLVVLTPLPWTMILAR